MADSQVLKALLPDNPLCGISTYKDTLNLATGVCTRQIKKLVLTGNESGWVMSGTGYFYNLTLSDNPKEMSAVVSTHFTATTTPGTVEIGCIRFGGTAQSPTQPLIFNYDNGAIGLTAFKQWLAAQYSAGTPVTVWYVLETPTTETIAVPSGLSGTEEGYLNQSGTPTPTNPVYPTANNVEVWLHSLRKLTTATEAVENPLYSDGTAITAYALKGNEEHTGTPTPSNPVDVNGVGVRTENLFDKNSMVVGYYLAKATGVYTATTGESRSVLVKVEPSTTYTITGTSWTKRIALFDNMPQNGDTPNYYSDNDTTAYEETSFTFTTLPTTQYLVFFNYSGSTEYPYNKTLNEVMGSVMLNTGSTAKPYEPWGYKIPISSGGVTTNIYLGSTQTVRRIKKFVLDGTENWSNQNVGQHGAVSIRKDELPLTPDMPAGTLNVLSTHFKAISNSSQLDIGEMVAGGSYLNFDYDGTNNLTDFKTYLATQYAAGTPVTVWYVLATAETAAVNEPLMKIGTYADTLSNATAIPTTEGANSITVDTTVQPSEFTATWTGWHDASVKEWDGSQWNE